MGDAKAVSAAVNPDDHQIVVGVQVQAVGAILQRDHVIGLENACILRAGTRAGLLQLLRRGFLADGELCSLRLTAAMTGIGRSGSFAWLRGPRGAATCQRERSQQSTE